MLQFSPFLKSQIMTIKFCGAAREVTGSAHLITLDSGYSILLDCGMYQGANEDMEVFNHQWEFDPETVDCVILSHAHIDHSGKLPKLTRDGFKGKIITTHASRDLSAIMLIDSARIQERDTAYLNKRLGRIGKKREIKPMYNTYDVGMCMQQFISVGYERWFRISDEAEVFLRDAGHILGSASVYLKLKRENGEWMTIGFTGDIGRPDRPILKDPRPMKQCDYIICESTYGGKEHRSKPEQEEEFLKIIKETCVQERGKLLIPAFSVGRTQELVYMLDKLETYRQLPSIPIFVDSPLAVNATNIFVAHPECFDDEILEYMVLDPNPFGFNNLHYIRQVEASKRLNHMNGPAIIISAAGMANAGRIQHHLYNHIEKSNTTILIVGYCAPSTLGGALRRGVEQVKIFGDVLSVNAEVKIMYSFSAHGDQSEMIEFLNNQDREQVKKVFLVHGEEKSQLAFKEALGEHGFKSVEIPKLGQEFVV